MDKRKDKGVMQGNNTPKSNLFECEATLTNLFLPHLVNKLSSALNLLSL